MSSITFRHKYPFTLDGLRTELQQAKLKQGADEVNLAHTQSYLDSQTPVCLGLGVTNKCNLRCTMCYYHEKEGIQDSEPTAEMDLDVLKKLLPKIPNLNQVMLGLEGEPLLYTKLDELLSLIKQYAANLVIVTNGNIITPRIVEILSKHHPDSIAVSLEAVEPELYAALRVRGQFSRVYEGIKQLKKCTDAVNFHVVVSQANVFHLKPIVTVAQELQVNLISLDQLHECSNSLANGLRLPDTDVLIEQTCDMANFADELGVPLLIGPNYAAPDVMDEFRARIGKHVTDIKYNPCPLLESTVNLLTHRQIFPCCGDLKPMDLNENELTFDGMFNHESVRLMRTLWALHQIPQVCKKCLRMV